MYTRFILKYGRVWLAAAAICGLVNVAAADIIAFSGAITQSTLDGTGPAVNNPALKMILDGDAFTMTIKFAGSITATSPNPHDLTGVSLTFQDNTNPASESSFGASSLTVSADGGFDDFSLLACLTTGSSCGAASNQLNEGGGANAV